MTCLGACKANIGDDVQCNKPSKKDHCAEHNHVCYRLYKSYKRLCDHIVVDTNTFSLDGDPKKKFDDLLKLYHQCQLAYQARLKHRQVAYVSKFHDDGHDLQFEKLQRYMTACEKVMETLSSRSLPLSSPLHCPPVRSFGATRLSHCPKDQESEKPVSKPRKKKKRHDEVVEDLYRDEKNKINRQARAFVDEILKDVEPDITELEILLNCVCVIVTRTCFSMSKMRTYKFDIERATTESCGFVEALGPHVETVMNFYVKHRKFFKQFLDSFLDYNDKIKEFGLADDVRARMIMGIAPDSSLRVDVELSDSTVCHECKRRHFYDTIYLDGNNVPKEIYEDVKRVLTIGNFCFSTESKIYIE